MASPDLLRLLEQHFGFSSFRAGQERVVRAALAGRDVLAVMPTGAGKSLTYQLPALASPGLTLVVSPLIALMKDQVDALERKGIAAAALHSQLSPEAVRHCLERLEQHSLLYLSPERLQQASLQQRLRQLPLARLVIDEAHCISEWGHDFRPEYRRIAAASAALGRPPITALTATATPAVQRDIAHSLALQRPVRISTGFARPNLSYRVWPAATPEHKMQLLEHCLREVSGACIIYASTRKQSEKLSAAIQAMGYACAHYHAGLPALQRQQLQEAFQQGRLERLTATNAFGMGVDKADVDAVLHYQLPSSLEAYYQEAGRAGRGGQAALCTLLYDPDDLRWQQQRIAQAGPSLLDLKRAYLLARNQQASSSRSSNKDTAIALSAVAQVLDCSSHHASSVLIFLAKHHLLANEGLAAILPEVSSGITSDIASDAILGASPSVSPSVSPNAPALPRHSPTALRLQLQAPFERQLPDFAALQQQLERDKARRYALLQAMEHYASVKHCRRLAISRYFEEASSLCETNHACGCDHCQPLPLPKYSRAVRARYA